MISVPFFQSLHLGCETPRKSPYPHPSNCKRPYENPNFLSLCPVKEPNFPPSHHNVSAAKAFVDLEGERERPQLTLPGTCMGILGVGSSSCWMSRSPGRALGKPMGKVNPISLALKPTLNTTQLYFSHPTVPRNAARERNTSQN